MQIRFGFLPVVLVLCTGLASEARDTKRANEEEPYPYGKAERNAGEVAETKGVVGLIAVGNRYRNDCVQGYRIGADFAEIERQGREAKNWFREVLKREPSNAYASLSIGYIDLILGRATPNRKTKENFFLAAMSRFGEALENRPGYADAHLYVAQVQALRGEYEQAEKNLRLIINSGIENSQVHSWMGFVLARSKRGEEGARHIARAIELDNPSHSAEWSRKNQQTVAAAK